MNFRALGKPAKCRQERVPLGHLGTMWLGRGATCEESWSCNWSVIRVFSGSQRKNRRKARVAFNRGQRAAMVGRDSGMQVRQPPGPSLLDIWRLVAKRTTLYMHPTGSAEVGIFTSVRLCSPALVFCCPSWCAWVPSTAWALVRPRAVATSPLMSNVLIDCRRTGASGEKCRQTWFRCSLDLSVRLCAMVVIRKYGRGWRPKRQRRYRQQVIFHIPVMLLSLEPAFNVWALYLSL